VRYTTPPPQLGAWEPPHLDQLSCVCMLPFLPASYLVGSSVLLCARAIFPPSPADAAGINLPDSPFGAGGEEEAEVEAMLEQQEAQEAKDTWYPQHRNCNCCKGFIHGAWRVPCSLGDALQRPLTYSHNNPRCLVTPLCAQRARRPCARTWACAGAHWRMTTSSRLEMLRVDTA
jgi:hypothetical protein